MAPDLLIPGFINIMKDIHLIILWANLFYNQMREKAKKLQQTLFFF